MFNAESKAVCITCMKPRPAFRSITKPHKEGESFNGRKRHKTSFLELLLLYLNDKANTSNSYITPKEAQI